LAISKESSFEVATMGGGRESEGGMNARGF